MADLLLRKVEVGDLKSHQLLEAKSPIVGKKEHDLVAKPLSLRVRKTSLHSSSE